MSGEYLLDTNILIALFANDAKVQHELKQAKSIFIPSIVFGELYYGAQKSSRVKENMQKIQDLLAASAILECDVETAQHYAIIKNKLRLKGKPIPENDIWIAAIAMQHHLVMVTRDAHFNEIENLSVQSW